MGGGEGGGLGLSPKLSNKNNKKIKKKKVLVVDTL